MEHIIHAAIRYPTVRCIIYGKDHAGCIKQAIKVFRGVESCSNRNQGFLTNKMRFVDRREAKGIAIASDQVRPELNTKTLTSEHFWHSALGGKHIYDSVSGYITPACPENFPKKSENNPCKDSQA